MTNTVAAQGDYAANSAKTIVTVNATPVGYNDNVTLGCSGAIAYDLQANVNNTSKGGNAVPSSFSWTVSSNSYVVGASASSGNTINQTLYNTNNSSQQVTYTVTPQATGTGTCSGSPFIITVTVPVCSSLSISKSADKTSVNKAGDVINYTITVVNTGNADQNNVVVNDPYLGGNLSNPTKSGGDNDNILEKGETWAYTGSYIVSQADLDNNGKPTANSGKIHNTASVVTTELPTAQTAVKDVDIILAPSWALSKSTTATTYSTVDELLSYTISVKNTGNVSISGITVSDPTAEGGVATYKSGDTTGDNKLDPTETWIYEATHKVTQADLNAGSYTNTATASGTPAVGTLTSATNQNTVPASTTPSWALSKSTTATTYSTVDELLSYTISVKNTGNVSISGITVSDPTAEGGVATYKSGDTTGDNKLDPTETWIYEATHKVTQADLNR